MTTTSEKILSEMERMGRMKIKDLCAQMHWQYQKFHRRLQANDFSPEDLALIAHSMNTLQPYLPPTTVEALDCMPGDLLERTPLLSAEDRATLQRAIEILQRIVNTDV